MTLEIPDAEAELLARTARNIVDAGVIRAAACAGNFEMMNRLLDAIGVPVSDAGITLADGLGLVVPLHLRPVDSSTSRSGWRSDATQELETVEHEPVPGPKSSPGANP